MQEEEQPIAKQQLPSVRSRILIAMMFITLLPITIIGAQGYHCARQAVIELTHKHILSTASARSDVIRLWLDHIQNHLETLGAAPALGNTLESSKLA